jgi:methionyl-tRNA formyltransferase
MRIALFGAVRASVSALDALAAVGLELHVFPLAPNKAARHSDYVDLALVAKAKGLRVTPVEDINATATMVALRDFAPDIICIFGWSQLVRKEFLELPRLGVLGWHPSLLPHNRGRAVIPWTILQDVRETGFSIFWIDAGMDSGDIAAQVCVPVSATESAATLYKKMEGAAVSALAKLMPALLAGELPRVEQDHEQASYCARRDREDGRIDWRQSAESVERLIRAAGAPYPGAFTESRIGEIVVDDATIDYSGRYWGAPGQVQWIDEDGVVVACGNHTALRLRAIRPVGQDAQPANLLLKMHEHLGDRARRST